jgi:hypothetical protein
MQGLEQLFEELRARYSGSLRRFLDKNLPVVWASCPRRERDVSAMHTPRERTPKVI